MESDSIIEFEEYIVNNRNKVNRYLNYVLWFFILTGPAIALGVRNGVFPDIEYMTCFYISLMVLFLSLIHFILYKAFPTSPVTCLFAVTALDIIIVYMSYNHVSIRLTWFLVPMLSILFYEKYMFFYAVMLNYTLMFITVWMTTPYYVVRYRYDSVAECFADMIGGYTIETAIMVASGYIICKIITGYLKSIFEQYSINEKQSEVMGEKMEILNSMAEIYDNVNLIDFVENTETSLRSENQDKHGIDLFSQTHTIMSQSLRPGIMPDQLDDFIKFTDIKTIRARLAHKKIVSADFIDVVSGWFRAQYITVNSTIDGIPNVVIFTTRNVDEEKRREEHLVRISMTDEMTRLYNRRCYDEDLKAYRDKELSDNLVIFSIDVNGLKTVNDTKGHAAGDELIKGAADCLLLSIKKVGKIYRTGGDEFMAIAHTDDPESFRHDIKERAAAWHGIYSEEITMSIGYAAYKDHRNADLSDLERLADSDMYAEKDRYYKEKGIDRRR